MIRGRYAAVIGQLLIAATCLLRAQEGKEAVSIERPEELDARFEYRQAQRLDARGEIPFGALVRAKEQLDQRGTMMKPRTPLDAGIWDWEELGPGNIGGRLRAILLHPTDENRIWVGTAGGGIWRTTDAGTTWEAAADFLASLNVVSLALDPTNPLTMYAGTGELIGSNGSFSTPGVLSVPSGAGIFKSSDGGVSWFQLSSTNRPRFSFVSRLAHHPSIAGRLLAATRSGLFLSTNGGASWDTTYYIPSTGDPVMDVKYHPANPNLIAVGTGRYSNPARGDMYLSTDGGGSWVRQTSGDSVKMPLRPGRCEIAFAASDPSVIYVSIGQYGNASNNLNGQIWRTTDGAATWEYFNPTNADPWSNAIWVSPADPAFVVWGGFGDLWRNVSSGGFVRISDWRCYHNQSECGGLSPHGDHHVIVPHIGFNGGSNRTVFIGNDGGIQRANDIATAAPTTGWVNLARNLGITQFFGGAASPDGSRIIGCSQDNGVEYYLPAYGTSWVQPLTGDGLSAAVDYGNPSRIFVSYPNLNIFRSDNGGLDFVPKHSGLGDTLGSRSLWGAPFVMDPNSPNVLVAGGQRIWRTTNSGDGWTMIRPALTGSPGCSAIDIAKSNSNVTWAAYANGALGYTTNAGGVWTEVVSPVPGRFVTDIAINPFAWNEVIVTVGGYSTDNIWYTTNLGVSWTTRTGTAPNELPAVQVNSLRYHPIQPNWIYAGTDLGVFASEDKGVNWSITPRYGGNEGPANVEVDELFWQGTSYLIAATHGRGMWRCKPLPVIYVDLAYVGEEDGSEFKPYNSVQEAVNAYGPGAIISIQGGTYDEQVVWMDKRGRFVGKDGVVRIQ